MLEDLKTDRLAQGLLATIILLGCLACGMVGLFVYARLDPASGAPVQQAGPVGSAPTGLPVESPPPTGTPTPTATPSPTETPRPTPTNTRVVDPTGAPTATPEPTLTPTDSPTPAAAGASPGPGDPDDRPPEEVTDWVRYESDTNKVAVNYPVTADEVLEESGVIQYKATVVDLAEGTIEQPVVMLHFYHQDSGYLPENTGPSDPVAMVAAFRDIYFMGQEDQLHELEPPRPTTFNGYSGAATVVNRVDPDRVDLFGPVDIVFYLAVVVHDDRLMRVQIQARKHNGGAFIPAFAGQALADLALW